MSFNLKTYKNKDGYTIKATEKAYKLFYEKQGFVEVKESKADKKKAAAVEVSVETPAEVSEEDTGEKAADESVVPDAPKETPKGTKKKKAE